MNKPHVRLFIVIAALVIGFIGCGDDDNGLTGPDITSELIPLAVGNCWIFDVETYVDDSLFYQGADTTEIEKDTTWGGYTWYDYQGWIRNAEDGLWGLLINDDYPEGIAELFIKYPASANDSWVLESDSTTITVESISETVTVPAGTFNGCYRIRMDFVDVDGVIEGQSIWVKPGIGVIQSEFTVEEVGRPEYRMILKLKEYHLE